MTYKEIIKFYENKDSRIDKNLNLTIEQKEEIKEFFHKHPEQERNIPNNQWIAKTADKQPTYQDFKNIINTFESRNTKSKANKIANKQGITGIKKGSDYLDLGEFVDVLFGNFHAYIPLTHLGAKTIAGKAVTPYPKDKDSAGWCIGQTDTNEYWNRYFFNNKSCFLVICGNNIPTKKVCFEILEEYDLNTIPSKLTRITNHLDNDCEINNLKIWDYYDNDFTFGTVVSRIYNKVNTSKEITYNDINTSIELLIGLIKKSKESSNNVRAKLLEELKKPIVIMPSEYNSKLVSLRATDEYKIHLNEGQNLLQFIDGLTRVFRKFEPNIQYSVVNSIGALSTIDSLINWFIDNRDIQISRVKYLPLFLYLKEDTFPNINYGVGLYDNLDNNCGILASSTQIVSNSNIYSYKYFKEHVFFRFPKKTGVIGINKEVVANFNEWDYLTVNDLIAFLGEAMTEKGMYKFDGLGITTNLKFVDYTTYRILKLFLSHGNNYSIKEDFPRIAKVINWQGSFDEFFYRFFSPLRNSMDVDDNDLDNKFINYIILRPEQMTLKFYDLYFSTLYPLQTKN